MKKDKVLVRRWPDQYALLGSPSVVLDVEEAALSLAKSTWMHSWCAAKIKEALLDGVQFDYSRSTDTGMGWRGRPDGIVAEYRLASDEEIQAALDMVVATSNGSHVSKKAQEKGYELQYQVDSDRTAAYAALPFQAKVVLDILNENGSTFTELRVQALMVEHGARLNTKQEPYKIFAFYRSRFLREEHLKEL
jgi:hypothetical protein